MIYVKRELIPLEFLALDQKLKRDAEIKTWLGLPAYKRKLNAPPSDARFHRVPALEKFAQTISQ